MPRLCSQVWIAPATYEEVVTHGQGLPGAAELARAAQDWVITEDPSPQSRAEFGAVQNLNDRDVLALAFQVRPDYLVTEDAGMRQLATSRNLAVLTVPELLLVAKQAGYLPAVKPVLDRMRARDHGIPQVSYDETLRMAGET
ncbi:MAG: hypothetical protein AB1758_38365 [Candidatus Eremiobacterota bacterium]